MQIFIADFAQKYLNYTQCFADGAVVVSLALKIFPISFEKTDIGQVWQQRLV